VADLTLGRTLRRARTAGWRARWWLVDALVPRRAVHARGITFSMTCPNWIMRFRMDTFATKEPETLDWIDAHVRDGDVVFDVGGNVGIYALYAALRHPRATVVVFEPEYANLHLLRDNIMANGLESRVQVYPLSVSDRTGLSRLHVQDLTPGAAMHTESSAALRTTETGADVVWAEGTWAMTLDDFCAQSSLWPNAIKIDVDGGEGRVLAGAATALARPALRSLIVEGGEAGLPADARDQLRAFGFSQVALAHRSEAGNEIWTR
jgi:FkbM family methyltransferase